ncbi:nonsense-mediated mRNA decay factor SMG7-like isoform X2 [Ziziphus jujuba]|uniref:Nonsense-mediated mRNA decay factor SMG7-like isoform X2 n=1 Tax=Ziziphus jujuba TaxID=326968 RepID=A0A6P6G987_ZIZJJ|nr:nonsense-mediated mRNA decay factor SMG7-like isoform X2 [Ziziphus jujuba]
MTAISPFPVKDQGQKQSFLLEVANREKQLWGLIYSKGLLHSDVQDLYHKVLSDYEKIILKNFEQSDLQDVEYSLWKLHYKHIDEFRKRIKKNSPTTESTKSTGPHNTTYVEGFKSFLSEATKFYQNLIVKVRKYYSLPEESLFYRKAGISSSVEPKTLQTCQFLCHRFLVCLGDLARYREQHEKPDNRDHNWSVAATHYMEATLIWPDSGNPQNQLAVLATYVGDEFLALYHCIRSLAVKEPFPEAQNNLILLLERNRSSHLHSHSNKAQFNFLKPFERSGIEMKTQSSDDFSDCNMLASENNGSIHTNFWSDIIKVISFFFIKSSLDEFPCAFTSCMKELDALMALDDTKLKAILESYQLMDSVRTGPFRALQVVATLLFTLQNLIERQDKRDSKDVKDAQNNFLNQWALTSTFIFMGRFVDRCLEASALDSCSLLPAVLVFVEWLVHMLDEVEIYVVDEKSRSAMSYFFGAYVHLLKRLNVNKNEISLDSTPLWEDYELRGFRPVASAQLSLNFSTHWEHVENFKSGADCRTRRIIRAGFEIAKRSSGFQKWIIYDQSRGEFQNSYMAGLKEFHDAEKMESINSDIKTDLPNQHYCKSEKEYANEIPGENFSLNGKCAIIEEEEVILFKPLTRYNSAPIYTSSNDASSPKELMDPIVPSDDCLRRATSLLIAQNQAHGESSAFHTDMTNFGNKSSKQLEPGAKDAGAQPFSDIPISAGPPSLSAWVLDKGSLNHDKEKAAGGSSKHGLSPIEEVVSESLNGLSISENEDPVNNHVSSTTSYSTSYLAPVPSAPLLPDDAVWFSGLQSSFIDSKTFEGVNSTETLCNAPQASSYPNWTAMRGPEDCGLGIPGFLDTYPPVRRMTSSEWLRQYRGNHNLERSYYAFPPFYSPGNLGNLYNRDASRFGPFDQLGNPLVSNPALHMENPPLYPAFPLDYGADVGQRREKLFHGYQRPNPFGCGAVTELRNEQQPLLQYLKEKERQLQQDPTARGPYMGN